MSEEGKKPSADEITPMASQEELKAVFQKAELAASSEIQYLLKSHGMVFTRLGEGGGMFLHPQYGRQIVPHHNRQQDLALLRQWMDEGLAQVKRDHVRRQAGQPAWRRALHGRWGPLVLATVAVGLLWLGLRLGVPVYYRAVTEPMVRDTVAAMRTPGPVEQDP